MEIHIFMELKFFNKFPESDPNVPLNKFKTVLKESISHFYKRPVQL